MNRGVFGRQMQSEADRQKMLFSCHLNSCFTLLELKGACLELKSLQSKETEDGSETEAELNGTGTVDDNRSAVITFTSGVASLGGRALGVVAGLGSLASSGAVLTLTSRNSRLDGLLRDDGLGRGNGLLGVLRSDGLCGVLRSDWLVGLLGVLAVITLTSRSVGVARDRLAGLLRNTGVAGVLGVLNAVVTTRAAGNDGRRLRDPGGSVSLDDGAGAVGDGESARLSNDVVLAANHEAGRAGAVGGVDIVHLGNGDGTVRRAGGNGNRTGSGSGLGSGEASKGKDDSGVLGVHFEGLFGLVSLKKEVF